jgi:DNA-binding CsgD family transcriptional regulator
MARTKRTDISPKQSKALALLAVGQSQAQAAQGAGVNHNTVTNWMRDEKFRAELRLMMERTRQQFESRVMQVANNAMVVVQELLKDGDKGIRAKGANLALNAAVRLSTRYRELQVEGAVQPTPLVIFPDGTRLPWAQKALAAPEHTQLSDPDDDGDIVDVEAKEIDGGGGDSFTDPHGQFSD